MNTTNKFPAGKYYIGDPCYAVLDSNWSKVIDETGCFGLEDNDDVINWHNGIFYYNGKKCFAGGTRYGDGCFYDNENREYGVDAGLIGIMPFSACDGDSMHGGNIVSFKEGFDVSCNNGIFNFGDVVINTGDEDDNPDYDRDNTYY